MEVNSFILLFSEVNSASSFEKKNLEKTFRCKELPHKHVFDLVLKKMSFALPMVIK